MFIRYHVTSSGAVAGRAMNRITKVLAVGIVILIVLLGVETYVLQTMGNGKNEVVPFRVACVGDSITAGTQYTVDLWQMLGSNYVVGNFGISGATVSLCSDNPYANTSALPVAKNFEPQVVIIMLGTNDANADLNETNTGFVNNYVQLINQFQGLASKPKLWIVLPPPIFNNSAGLSPNYLAQNILPDIQQVANKTGASLIDVYHPMLNSSKYFPDGVHPDSDGSEVIATIMYNTVFAGNLANTKP